MKTESGVFRWLVSLSELNNANPSKNLGRADLKTFSWMAVFFQQLYGDTCGYHQHSAEKMEIQKGTDDRLDWSALAKVLF